MDAAAKRCQVIIHFFILCWLLFKERRCFFFFCVNFFKEIAVSLCVGLVFRKVTSSFLLFVLLLKENCCCFFMCGLSVCEGFWTTVFFFFMYCLFFAFVFLYVDVI